MREDLSLDLFDYELPDGQIAQYAAENRDSSRLLVFRKGKMEDALFNDLPSFFTEGSTLFFNNAKVIPARLFGKNKKGSLIEIFLLQPHQSDYSTALAARGGIAWECLVGNSRKWKDGEELLIQTGSVCVRLSRLDRYIVYFAWDEDMGFAELLESLGKMPIPPYIKRASDDYDKLRYQTVYSNVPGSVAAPTAGLHFTEAMMQRLTENGFHLNFVTLHVGAGTFLPVKTRNVLEHAMHKESFSIHRSAIVSLIESKQTIAVGTTSCRVLESLFWAAVNIRDNLEDPFVISQFVYFGMRENLSKMEALEILIQYMDVHKIEEINGETSIMIVPGYTFKMIHSLLTNFHQPKSTLLMMISALIGEEWKTVYQHALKNKYRFLSYGDSSLLIP